MAKISYLYFRETLKFYILKILSIPYPIWDLAFYFFTPSPLKLILPTTNFLGLSRNKGVIYMYEQIPFDPEDFFRQPLKKYELFSSYLKDTDNLQLQRVRESLVKKLIKSKIIGGNCLSLDSCPIKDRC